MKEALPAASFQGSRRTAKKREEIYVPGRVDALVSDPDQLGVKLLRRLRDEAHRFAINFHRQKRGNRMTRSRLGDIPGVGSKKLKDLLAYFKSVDAIEMASVDQILSVPGFGAKTAKIVWMYFHSDTSEIGQ